MASYHAALAAGGELVEYPMLAFPLSDEMLTDQARIEGGQLLRPTAPGLGLTLTPEIEARYPFDEAAVYCYVLNDWGPPPDSYWSRWAAYDVRPKETGRGSSHGCAFNFTPAKAGIGPPS